MEKENAVKILEVCKVSPSSHSSSKFSLPLAAFDWLFINFPPLDRVIYYSISDNYSDSFFHSIIIPKLKHSLSLTLTHFLPLAGNLLWPADSPLPFILYSPNDAVSFTVAETDSDFHHVSGNHPRQIKDSQPFVPMMQPSNSCAAVPLMAVQVTHFPNHGFCIGLSTHHVLLDDKSFTFFLKSWAHINQCLLELSSPSYNLPSEFTPSFERPTNVLRNPFDFVPKNRSLKFSPLLMPPSNRILGTFELTPTHIQKLKKRVLEEIEKTSPSSLEQEGELHLSTFVMAYAYVLTCLIKAKQGECKELVHLSLAADARGLLDPPISSHYFGNCVTHPGMVVEAREFREEGDAGFPNIAKKISHLILELKRSRAIEAHKPPDVDAQQHSFLSEIEACTAVASPKFKYYQTDFGWGNPRKCEIVSLASNNIALTDTTDGGGGIQVSLVLPNHHQMDVFVSLFDQGLN